MTEEKTMAEASSLGALASRFIEIESIPWIETAPGNKMKVIYHDPATYMLTILSKLEPGAGIPPHVHEDLEQTFVLEGSLVDQEGECTAGNFVIRAKGSRHAPTAPKGCTMVVFFLKPTAALKKALLEHA
jgi:anti-sigma factor ChrR (cupin superfamily)